MNHITHPMDMPHHLLGNTTMQSQSSAALLPFETPFRSCQIHKLARALLSLVLAFFSLTKPEHVW